MYAMMMHCVGVFLIDFSPFIPFLDRNLFCLNSLLLYFLVLLHLPLS